MSIPAIAGVSPQLALHQANAPTGAKGAEVPGVPDGDGDHDASSGAKPAPGNLSQYA